MEAEVRNENGNYIVCIRVQDTDGAMRFKPYANFGDRQGDAIIVRDYFRADYMSVPPVMRQLERYNSDDKYMLNRNRHSPFIPLITKQI